MADDEDFETELPLTERLSYTEARSNMASMLGNFGYGWDKTSLAGFMDEMVNFFSHKNRVTEGEFVESAREAWKRETST